MLNSFKTKLVPYLRKRHRVVLGVLVVVLLATGFAFWWFGYYKEYTEQDYWYWVGDATIERGHAYWAWRLRLHEARLEWSEPRPYREIIKVDLSTCCNDIHEAVWIVGFLKSVREVHIHRRDFSGTAPAFLAALEHVEVLDFSCSQLNDQGLVLIEQLQNLRQLNLAETKITDKMLQWVGQLQDLHILNLEATQVTDAGLLHLQRLPHLQRVNLRQTQVTDSGVAELQKAMPQLQIVR